MSSDQPWPLQGAIDVWQEEETADKTAKISGSGTNIKRSGPSSLGSSRMGDLVLVDMHPGTPGLRERLTEGLSESFTARNDRFRQRTSQESGGFEESRVREAGYEERAGV